MGTDSGGTEHTENSAVYHKEAKKFDAVRHSTQKCDNEGVQHKESGEL